MRAPVAEKLAELRKEIGRIMVEKTPRKGFTRKQREAVLEAQQGRCGGCEADLEPGFHIDHVKALADGGAHEPANWLGLCPPCHKRKTAREVTARAKTERIRTREQEGPKPSRIHSRNEWPKGRKLQSRTFQRKAKA